MKKRIFAPFLLLLVTTVVFSQTNKPGVGDWGVRYGVYFNGSFSQQLIFTRMLKKNLEVGMGVGISFQSRNTTSTDSVLVSAIGGDVPGIREYTTQTTNLYVSLNPFLLYHFPVKNNLDLYMGAGISLGVSDAIANKEITRRYLANYEYKEEVINRSPVLFVGGASAIVGCQYFFYKNLAIGAQGGLGFSVNGSSGKVNSKKTVTNSGVLNPVQGIVTIDDQMTQKTISTSAGIAGNVGLNLTFYFSRVKAKETAPAFN